MKVWIKHRENQDIDIIIPHSELIEGKNKEAGYTTIIKLPYNLVFRIFKPDRKRLSQKYVTQIFEKNDDSIIFSIDVKVTQYNYVEEIKISKSGILDILRRNHEFLKTVEYTLVSSCPVWGDTLVDLPKIHQKEIKKKSYMVGSTNKIY